MLGNNKLNSLDTRLEQFKLSNATHQNELQGVLRDYSQLLEDYKILKRAFEVKSGDIAPGNTGLPEKTRNSYVLVLVDGNGYIFNDELVSDKEEGGMRAARMLNDAVEKYLRESLPRLKNARIIVRIYADLTTLSKQLARSKLIGLEKRSLAPFSAAFTRAISLFDFVDALDEEGTKFKLRETFKQAADDSACSHILYAACHDAGYLPQLVPYSGLQDKITLIQGADFNPEFHQFGLNVTQFPTIFRWSPLPAIAPSFKSQTPTPSKQAFSTKAKTAQKALREAAIRNGGSWRNHAPDDVSLTADDKSPFENQEAGNELNIWDAKTTSNTKTQPPCKYFQKGFCRYGNKCNFQHVASGSATGDYPANGVTVDRSNISSLLPTTTVPGFVPLNKDGQRLDAYIRPPTSEEWVVYNAHFHRQKPCNHYHLLDVCTKFNCPYDHTPLEPSGRHCLEYAVKCSPCPRKGSCRASSCIYGHLCQKDDCMGQMKGCRMKSYHHNVDPELASMVPAEDDNMEFDDRTGESNETTAVW